jgi:hypothetical protein
MAVGAIRWDAWIGDLGSGEVGAPSVGLQVERDLGPHEFHDRLPFYATITGPDTVQIRELSQSVMDRDIAYARHAGIDYWAFVYYPAGSGMDTGRNLYLSSHVRGDLRFCFVVEGSHMPPADFGQLIAAFKHPSYQTVLGGRPLLYLFNAADYTADDIAALRRQTRSAGLPNPYLVGMNQSAAIASSAAKQAGVDALSAYITWTRGGGPYADLMAREQRAWDQHRATGMPVIPWVTAGLDARPRYLHPVSWTTVQADDWVQRATPHQVGAELQAALEWVSSNRAAAQANAVLIYAWNEFDEGGWICPTLLHGTDRLDAIKAVIDRFGH